MTTHPLDILIQESPVYIKPLGFMYEPDNETVSNFEKQIHVRKTSVGYSIKEWILNANNDVFYPTKEHNVSTIEAVEAFLDAHPSIY